MRKAVALLLVSLVLVLSGCVKIDLFPEAMSSEEQATFERLLTQAEEYLPPSEREAGFAALDAEIAKAKAAHPKVVEAAWEYIQTIAVVTNSDQDVASARVDAFANKFPDSDYSTRIMLEYAGGLFDSRDFEAAQPWYERLQKADNYGFMDLLSPAEVSYSLSVCYLMAGRNQEALDTATNLPGLSFGRMVLAQQVAAIAKSELGDYKGALESYIAYFHLIRRGTPDTDYLAAKRLETLDKLQANLTGVDAVNAASLPPFLFGYTSDQAFNFAEKFVALPNEGALAPSAIVYYRMMEELGEPDKDIDEYLIHWQELAGPDWAPWFFALRTMRLFKDDLFKETLEFVELAPEELRAHPDTMLAAARSAMHFDRYAEALAYADSGLKLVLWSDLDLESVKNICSLIGKKVPEIEGTDLRTGKPVKLSDTLGKVTILDMREWNEELRLDELKFLIDLTKRYDAADLAVFTVTIDTTDFDDPNTKEWICSTPSLNNMTWPHIYGGTSQGAIASKFGVKEFPWLLVIDRDGTARYWKKWGEFLYAPLADMIDGE